jgi:hypothetical protein
MDLLKSAAAEADGLNPVINSLLTHFRDEGVPVELSAAIVVMATLLLVAIVVFGILAVVRVRRLRAAVVACGTTTAFKAEFATIDNLFAASPFRASWREYRKCLREGDDAIFYLRRPDEFLGLHTLGGKVFPTRFFAAAHGYFIGIGLVLTFIGLVAALKFAATGVASPDMVVAKTALNALLAAAAFKFMTSIAGLGSALVLSIAARTATYFIESETLGLASDLENAMEPIFSEGLAYDQLAATRAQLSQLERIESGLNRLASRNSAAMGAAPPASSIVFDNDALQKMLGTFLLELRGSAGLEMKQLVGKLSDVGGAIGAMQSHIGRSGEQFAAQIELAAMRLLAAATSLQQSCDLRNEQISARLEAQIDRLATAFARGETMFSNAGEKAAGALVQSAGEIDASLRTQIASMHDVARLLDRMRDAIGETAAHWTQCTAPILASVESSRQVSTELSQVAGQVGAAQRDMAAMAKSVAQLSERVGTVWENYRNHFEKVDDDLEAVFAQLQGGTRAFGDEVMAFVRKLDASLASGMQAFSLGTEELRDVAQMFVVNGQSKAA